MKCKACQFVVGFFNTVFGWVYLKWKTPKKSVNTWRKLYLLEFLFLLKAVPWLMNPEIVISASTFLWAIWMIYGQRIHMKIKKKTHHERRGELILMYTCRSI